MNDQTAITTAQVDDHLSGEFPELALHYRLVEGRQQRSPRPVRDQLAHLSNRVFGEAAIKMRKNPIAHAYRVFFRHIGLDPDETRPPFEAMIVERLRAGRFASQNLIADAVTVAILETGAAVIALDADAFDGPPVLRLAAAHERFGEQEPAPALREGTIVIADRSRPLAVLFGDAVPAALIDRSTRSVLLCAIAVTGVPGLVVEEALWKCGAIITGDQAPG